MSLRNLRAITVKELRHILRDRTTFFLVTLSPLVLLFLLAYAVTAEIEHVPLAVVDLERSPTSRAFIQQITLGDDLDLYTQLESADDIERLLERGEIKVAVVIHPAFERDLLTLQGVRVQIIVDGTEPQSGGFAVEHIQRRASEFISHLLTAQMRARGLSLESLQPIDLRVRTWFNPNLKPRLDLIPGLLSLVLGMPGMSVALTLAREREHGTMEQLMATPIGRAELLVGKMIPYVISGLLNVVLLTLTAIYWFRVPFRGSFPLFFLLSLFFLFALLSVGIIIGVFIRTQAASLALSFLVIFFPGFFLTGLFFPVVSMPQIVRLESYTLPGTHYATITRTVFTMGMGWEVLWLPALALLGLGFGFTAVAAFFFRKKLA